MKIGFTGTRTGMSERQRSALKRNLGYATEFHHGDCIGADFEAHNIAKEMGIKIIIHPPINDKMRAFCEGDEEKIPMSYLKRNQNIVDLTDVLIAAPKGTEEKRSGTWATIRYAKKIGKKIFILIRQ